MIHRAVLVAAFALLQAPPADPLIADLRTLTLAEDGGGRFDAIAGMLRARRIPFSVEPFTLDTRVGPEPRTEGRNIVVTLGEGSDDVVIGAHYDAARLPDGTLSQGAVDNASSSVALVLVADTLRAERLAMRVRIVWFDVEESGLIGSRRYVAAHAGDRIRAMLNFDINGYGDTVAFGPPAGGESAWLLRTMAQACADEGLDCVRFAQMPVGDDRPFGAAKIPTLSIAQLPALEVHQLWLLLHGGKNSGLAQGTQPTILRTIHTADDVVDKVDRATIERAHRLAVALVRLLPRRWPESR